MSERVERLDQEHGAPPAVSRSVEESRSEYSASALPGGAAPADGPSGANGVLFSGMGGQVQIARVLRLQRLQGNSLVSRMIAASGKDAASIIQAARRAKPTGTADWARQVGGALLKWDPYGEKVLLRYATNEEHDQYTSNGGKYSLVALPKSTRIAVWFFAEGGGYHPNFAGDRKWVAKIQISIPQNAPLINYESRNWAGEAGHPGQIIVKNNEEGAYGIGRQLIDNYPVTWIRNK